MKSSFTKLFALMFLLTLILHTFSTSAEDLGRDRLGPDEQLVAGQSITSADGRFVLRMRDNGSLTLYQKDVSQLWSTGTGGSGAVRAIMQSDGNLVLYTANGTPVWASNTGGGSSMLVMQNDGNAVIYREMGDAVWATNTVVDSPQPPITHQTANQAINVGIGVNYMKAIRTTENFLWNDADEVYMIASGAVRNADGQTFEISPERIVPDPHKFGDGWERFDYYHLMGGYHNLYNGDELNILVYVMEDDEGWDPIQCGPLRETMNSLGGAIASAISEDWIGAGAAALNTVRVGSEFLDKVGSCGDDTIGAFAVAVRNTNGSLSIDWQPVGDTHMRASGESIDSPDRYSLSEGTARFWMLQDSRGEYLVDTGVWVP